MAFVWFCWKKIDKVGGRERVLWTKIAEYGEETTILCIVSMSYLFIGWKYISVGSFCIPFWFVSFVHLNAKLGHRCSFAAPKSQHNRSDSRSSEVQNRKHSPSYMTILKLFQLFLFWHSNQFLAKFWPRQEFVDIVGLKFKREFC